MRKRVMKLDQTEDEKHIFEAKGFSLLRSLVDFANSDATEYCTPGHRGGRLYALMLAYKIQLSGEETSPSSPLIHYRHVSEIASAIAD